MYNVYIVQCLTTTKKYQIKLKNKIHSLKSIINSLKFNSNHGPLTPLYTTRKTKTKKKCNTESRKFIDWN